MTTALRPVVQHLSMRAIARKPILTDTIFSQLSLGGERIANATKDLSIGPISHVVAGHQLTIFTRPDVFKPTLTTWLLIQQAVTAGVFGKSVLDLGCGSGPIAIALARCGAAQVHATDLMPQACELTRKNSEVNGVANKIAIRQGDLFDSVPNLKFDVIVDDVSGVAEPVARISSWFPDGVPLAGSDGTSLTIRMLQQAEEHLKPGGHLYFPVISLSASSKIVEAANRLFGNRLTRVASKLVPFNQELKDHIDALIEMRNAGLIEFDQVRTRLMWKLDVYSAMAKV